MIGCRLDTRPVPILYVGPSKEFNTDQFEPRLKGLFDEAPDLKAKLARGKREKKTLKRVAGVTLRLGHAGSSTSLKSDPAGLGIVDEYDEMLSNVKGQGDPLGLVEARGFTYADFKVGIASTPSKGLVEVETDPLTGLEFWQVGETDAIQSPIWRLWQEGTRYHWAWKCLHCAEWFIPRFSCIEASIPKGANPLEAKRAAFVQCPRNGCVLVDEDKAALNAKGQYIAPGQWFDENDVVCGEPPETTTLSFWVSGLASPFVTFGDRVEAYVKALRSGEPDKVQTEMNAGFGELSSSITGDAPEWEEVARLRMPYKPLTVPAEAAFMTAGVDVQKNRLVYVKRAWGGRAKSWLIDYGELFGETSEPEVWEDLADLLTQPVDGMHVRLAFVDSGFRPGKKFLVPENRVYSFARRFPRLVLPSKGYRTLSRPVMHSQIEVTGDGKANKYGLTLARLDTDHWKSWVHERIRYPVDSQGAWLLHEEVSEGYCEQIVSEARTTTPSGSPVWQTLSRENHFLDAEAMAAAAGYQLNAHRLSPNYRRASDDSVEEIKQIPVPDANVGTEQKPTNNSAADRFERMAQLLNG